MIRTLSRLLIISGCAMLVWSGVLIYRFFSPQKKLFSIQVPATQAGAVAVAHSSKPLSLAIPKLQIHLAVVSGTVENNQWTMTRRGVSYLTSSPIPGEHGNSILYGHNDLSLLGNLTKARPGDLIEVTMDDGTPRLFVVDLTGEVTPKQTEILDDAGDTRLTIFTCSGLFDQKRFVVVAKPVEKPAEKPAASSAGRRG